MKIDLAIVTYKPSEKLINLIGSMSAQTCPLNKIIIMNIEQKYFERIAFSSKFVDSHKNIEVHHISRREFDNGKTRNQAVKYSDADGILFMDQDCEPTDETLLEKLVKAISDDANTAFAYARQIPVQEATESDKYISRFYYPEDSCLKSIKDYETDGWTAYLNSNVCALYKRDIFDELGGFTNHAICNEDVIYAANALNAGYKSAYVADATVVVDKRLTISERKKKHFDVTVSRLKHPEIFDMNDIKASEKKLNHMCIAYLKRSGFAHEILKYKRLVAAKRIATGKALRYRHLSQSALAKISANPTYWARDEILRDRAGINGHGGYGRSEAEMQMLSQPPVVKNRITDK